MLSPAAPASHLLHRCLPSTAPPAGRDLHRAAVPLSSRRVISVRASLSSWAPEKANSGRRTLAGGWDITSSAGPWMPRMEDLDPTNLLLRQRIVFLGSRVDTDTADLVISQLLFLDAEDQEKDITLFINSSGGDTTAGLGIYDAMKLCKADVSTVCVGLAASMGAFLLAAGTKGKRYCMPNARVMIHQQHGASAGNASVVTLQIKETMYHKIKTNKILSRITGKPVKQIEVDMTRENFLTPWEAKEYGLVDGVVDEGKPGLVAPSADEVPPPKTQIWDYWTVGNTPKRQHALPSEMNLLQNGGGSEEKGREQVQEPSPV